MIDEYLIRCEEETGEIDDLVSESSSDGDYDDYDSESEIINVH